MRELFCAEKDTRAGSQEMPTPKEEETITSGTPSARPASATTPVGKAERPERRLPRDRSVSHAAVWGSWVRVMARVLFR